MPSLEFVSRTSRDPANPQATAERLVNLYPEPMPQGARAAFALKPVPGTEAFASLTGVFTRGIINAPAYSDGSPSDRLALVNDGKLQELDSAGVLSTLGLVPDDAATGISTNNGKITVTASGRYFVWTGAALSEVVSAPFTSFGGVEFIGNRTVLTERGGRRIAWSDLADPATVPGLNFGTAENKDDVTLRPMAIGGNLWIFNTTSIEIWGLTGGAGANALARLGPVIETGLKSYPLCAKIPNGAFFIGNDGIVYMTGGGAQLQPISTPAVNEAIAEEEPTGCFHYEAKGHSFCVVRFRERPALCFDLATGVWHERADGDNGAWGATCAAQAFGSWFFAGYDGKVRKAVQTQQDAGATMFRRAVSRPIFQGRARFKVPMIEVMGQVGMSDIGRDAMVQMRLSRDGGRTWGHWREESFGNLGDYDARAVFRSNGQARTLVAEIRVTDPAVLTMWSAAEVQVA